MSLRSLGSLWSLLSFVLCPLSLLSFAENLRHDNVGGVNDFLVHTPLEGIYICVEAVVF